MSDEREVILTRFSDAEPLPPPADLLRTLRSRYKSVMFEWHADRYDPSGYAAERYWEGRLDELLKIGRCFNIQRDDLEPPTQGDNAC